MTGRLQVVVLGIAGLAAAAILGLTGYLVARDTIALPATSLPAGEGLAPQEASIPADVPAPATATTGATTGDDDARATTEEDDDSSGPSGSKSSGSGSDSSGRGRGRGRGGDD